MSRILVSGSIAYDRIMDFPGYFRDHFLPDKMHAISVSFQVETTAENFGGTAGNIAYNLTLLGLEPRIIATGGSDFERYASYLKTQRIDPVSVKIESASTTSAAFVMTDKENNQIAAFSMGAGKTPYLPLPEATGARCAIVGAGCVRDMQALPGHYRELGLQYMYDPGQQIPALSADDLKDGIAGAAVLFANDYEFGLINAKTGWDESQLLEKVPVVVVTYGEKGSRVLTKDVEYKIAAAPVAEAKDPTGAGDAYRAGFIAGWSKKVSPEGCAKIGSAVAAYAVETYGTQSHRFTIAELAARHESAYGETLPL
jgi:adenosine kinase